MKKFGKYTLIASRRGERSQKQENNSENFVVSDNTSHIFKLNAYLDVVARHNRLLNEIKKKAEVNDVN